MTDVWIHGCVVADTGAFTGLFYPYFLFELREQFSGVRSFFSL